MHSSKFASTNVHFNKIHSPRSVPFSAQFVDQLHLCVACFHRARGSGRAKSECGQGAERQRNERSADAERARAAEHSDGEGAERVGKAVGGGAPGLRRTEEAQRMAEHEL